MYCHWLQGGSELEGSFRPQPPPVSIHSRMFGDNLRKSLDIFVLSGPSRCQSRKDFFFLTFWLHLSNFLLSLAGIEPSPPLQWKHVVLTTGLPGKSPERIIGAAANRSPVLDSLPVGVGVEDGVWDTVLEALAGSLTILTACLLLHRPHSTPSFSSPLLLLSYSLARSLGFSDIGCMGWEIRPFYFTLCLHSFINSKTTYEVSLY